MKTLPLNKIDRFKGEYEFLSNFSYSPFTYKDVYYPTVEHFFQANKTTNEKIRNEIAAVPTPSQAKYRGRAVQLRSDWRKIRINVMEIGLREKFNQNPDLKQKLLDTGDAYLEEGNTWGDRYWGVCNGYGENHLGQLLMKLREEYKNA